MLNEIRIPKVVRSYPYRYPRFFIIAYRIKNVLEQQLLYLKHMRLVTVKFLEMGFDEAQKRDT